MCHRLLPAIAVLGGLASAAWAEPIVVAHRGACGYLPEHTPAAQALAYAMRPHYIEQDVVMTQDGKLVVLHDLYLDRMTDVAERFPDRARDDGRYYVIDFTLAEIKQLRVTERFTLDEQGRQVPAWPERFPLWKGDFSVATLGEAIELIQGLNAGLGYDIGIYPEIKAPWLHRREGRDISRAVLEELKKYGYTQKTDKVYLQCFDPHELARIHDELLPALEMELKLVQLIAETDWNETMVADEQGNLTPYDYGWMHRPGAMQRIARVADGIGPWMPMVVSEQSTRGNIVLTGLVAEAHRAGLVVHPYTFRAEADRIPDYAEDFDDLLDIFINTARIDGMFTDFPDRAVRFIERQQRQSAQLDPPAEPASETAP